MKHALHLFAVIGGPFRCAPAMSVELDDDRIMADGSDCSACFPWESYCGRTRPRLWVVGNEYGALGAVWARNEGDALNELVNRDLGGGLLVDCTPEEAEEMEYVPLGNAGEWADLTYAWCRAVEFDPKRDIALICAICRAAGAGVNVLAKA